MPNGYPNKWHRVFPLRKRKLTMDNQLWKFSKFYSFIPFSPAAVTGDNIWRSHTGNVKIQATLPAFQVIIRSTARVGKTGNQFTISQL